MTHCGGYFFDLECAGEIRLFRKVWIASLVSVTCVPPRHAADLGDEYATRLLLISLMSTVASLPFPIFTLPAGALGPKKIWWTSNAGVMTCGDRSRRPLWRSSTLQNSSIRPYPDLGGSDGSWLRICHAGLGASPVPEIGSPRDPEELRSAATLGDGR